MSLMMKKKKTYAIDYSKHKVPTPIKCPVCKKPLYPSGSTKDDLWCPTCRSFIETEKLGIEMKMPTTKSEKASQERREHKAWISSLKKMDTIDLYQEVKKKGWKRHSSIEFSKGEYTVTEEGISKDRWDIVLWKNEDAMLVTTKKSHKEADRFMLMFMLTQDLNKIDFVSNWSEID